LYGGEVFEKAGGYVITSIDFSSNHYLGMAINRSLGQNMLDWLKKNI
jgi:hypothetical protein